MAKNLPEKHHYVPKFSTKYFADSNGMVFYRERGRNIEHRNYKSPFYKRHYYTSRDADNKKDISAEYKFQKVENEVSRIIKKICTCCANGSYPKLTPGEKQAWDMFLFLQLQRTPDAFEQLVKEESLTEIIEDCFEQWMADDPSNKVKILTHYTSENIERSKNTIRIGVQSMVGPISLKLFSKLELSFWILTDENRSFVLGSNPVVRGSVYSSYGWGTWIPISPKVAVPHTRQRTSGELLQNNSVADVRQLNMAIIKQSSAVVSNSKRLLKSLTKNW